MARLTEIKKIYTFEFTAQELAYLKGMTQNYLPYDVNAQSEDACDEAIRLSLFNLFNSAETHG